MAPRGDDGVTARPTSIVVYFGMVHVDRFELPTLWSQARCASRLRYTWVKKFGRLPGWRGDPYMLPNMMEAAEIESASTHRQFVGSTCLSDRKPHGGWAGAA